MTRSDRVWQVALKLIGSAGYPVPAPEDVDGQPQLHNYGIRVGQDASVIAREIDEIAHEYDAVGPDGMVRIDGLPTVAPPYSVPPVPLVWVRGEKTTGQITVTEQEGDAPPASGSVLDLNVNIAKPKIRQVVDVSELQRLRLEEFFGANRQSMLDIIDARLRALRRRAA